MPLYIEAAHTIAELRPLEIFRHRQLDAVRIGALRLHQRDIALSLAAQDLHIIHDRPVDPLPAQHRMTWCRIGIRVLERQDRLRMRCRSLSSN